LPRGREGHARIAILTVIPEEMDEVLQVLGATTEVEMTGVFTSPDALAEGLDCLPFVVSRCSDRSNGPASESARALMEEWRPETIMLVGIAEREARKLNWNQVAEQSGVTASTLTRMAQGKRPDVDSLAALTAWSGLSQDSFVRTENDDSKPEPATLAMISTYLRADKNLSASAAALEQLIATSYDHFRRN
jgi:transcriptional regulator with XRE-family HTH domain